MCTVDPQQHGFALGGSTYVQILDGGVVGTPKSKPPLPLSKGHLYYFHINSTTTSQWVLFSLFQGVLLILGFLIFPLSIF